MQQYFKIQRQKDSSPHVGTPSSYVGVLQKRAGFQRPQSWVLSPTAFLSHMWKHLKILKKVLKP